MHACVQVYGLVSWCLAFRAPAVQCNPALSSGGDGILRSACGPTCPAFATWGKAPTNFAATLFEMDLCRGVCSAGPTLPALVQVGPPRAMRYGGKGQTLELGYA